MPRRPPSRRLSVCVLSAHPLDFALIGASIVIYNKRKPKFTPEFQRLGNPTS